MTPRRRRRTVPWPLLVPATVAAALLLIPLAGLLIRAPWSSLPRLVTQPDVRSALVLSLVCATIATLLAAVLGLPLAWLLARSRARGVPVLRALVTLPLVLPPVVGGVALLLAFGRQGILGRPLEQAFGITLPFTPAAVVLAETFVAMPFFVITVEGALRAAGQDLEEAAATLGAGPLRTFRLVTVPAMAPALLAGGVLCWARALGEFGATITFAGSFPGRTQTMPLAAYLALQTDPDAAIALSLVLLLICVLVLIGLRERWWPAATRRTT